MAKTVVAIADHGYIVACKADFPFSTLRDLLAALVEATFLN